MVAHDEEICFDARRHGAVLARPLAQAVALALAGGVLLAAPWPRVGSARVGARVGRRREPLPPTGICLAPARGGAGTAVFLDDDERRLFLRLFAAEVERHDWRCHAFCLMTTLYHLVVESELW